MHLTVSTQAHRGRQGRGELSLATVLPGTRRRSVLHRFRARRSRLSLCALRSLYRSQLPLRSIYRFQLLLPSLGSFASCSLDTLLRFPLPLLALLLLLRFCDSSLFLSRSRFPLSLLVLLLLLQFCNSTLFLRRRSFPLSPLTIRSRLNHLPLLLSTLGDPTPTLFGGSAWRFEGIAVLITFPRALQGHLPVTFFPSFFLWISHEQPPSRSCTKENGRTIVVETLDCRLGPAEPSTPRSPTPTSSSRCIPRILAPTKLDVLVVMRPTESTQTQRGR